MAPFSASNARPFDPGPPILGQTLVKDATAYTPWMPSQGDAVTIAVEVIGRATNATLTVTLQHKNPETIDSSATSDATTISANASGISKQRYTGLKQLVRLRFDAGGSAAMDWSHVRMLAPAWEHNGRGLGSGTVPTVPGTMLGTTLFKGITAYTPWMPRRGNNATFYMQVVAATNGTLTATVQTKGLDDPDSSASDMANTITGTTAGAPSARNTSIDELWRYKLVVTGTNTYDWIHFRPLMPEWEEN